MPDTTPLIHESRMVGHVPEQPRDRALTAHVVVALVVADVEYHGITSKKLFLYIALGRRVPQAEVHDLERFEERCEMVANETDATRRAVEVANEHFAESARILTEAGGTVRRTP